MDLWVPNSVEERQLISIHDPAFAALIGIDTHNYTGVTINETSALSVAAVWRAVWLIATTVASLPMKAIADEGGHREQVEAWTDNPGSPVGLTPFEWKETVMAHLLLHGNAYLIPIENQVGGVIGLQPIHPALVAVERERFDSLEKTYKVTMRDGAPREYTDDELVHIPALSTDGLRGYGPVEIARNSLGIAIAADRATGRMFSDGAFIKGVITPEEDLTKEEAETIAADLDLRISGWDNAGGFPIVNRKLKFQPWMMTNEDAQFLQSRQFQIEEIARWFGVPPYELMQTEKQTSWGTGIEAQQRGLSRQVLGPWVARIEHRISPLLPDGARLEFDFTALERPTPEQEIDLLVQQVSGGIMTANEARAIRNLPPLPDGDRLLLPAMTRPDEEAQNGE